MQMSSSKDAILKLMNEYCYLIDAGNMEGFASLFKHADFHVLGDPDGARNGSGEVLELLQNVALYDGKTHANELVMLYERAKFHKLSKKEVDEVTIEADAIGANKDDFSFIKPETKEDQFHFIYDLTCNHKYIVVRYLQGKLRWVLPLIR